MIVKKFSMNVYDNCGCDEWAAAFVKTVFTHAKIGAEELVIYDMDDKRIFIRAEVWDASLEPDEYDDKPGGWVEKAYTIKYYQEDEPWRKFLLSYVLYDDERTMVAFENANGGTSYHDLPTKIEYGAYRIVPWWGKAKCIRKKI
jgi:hypothetical protein